MALFIFALSMEASVFIIFFVHKWLGSAYSGKDSIFAPSKCFNFSKR